MPIHAVSRLTLIAEPRVEPQGSAVVRRYRLARLYLNGRYERSPDRHSHLKRVYD